MSHFVASRRGCGLPCCPTSRGHGSGSPVANVAGWRIDESTSQPPIRRAGCGHRARQMCPPRGGQVWRLVCRTDPRQCVPGVNEGQPVSGSGALLPLSPSGPRKRMPPAADPVATRPTPAPSSSRTGLSRSPTEATEATVPPPPTVLVTNVTGAFASVILSCAGIPGVFIQCDQRDRAALSSGDWCALRVRGFAPTVASEPAPSARTGCVRPECGRWTDRAQLTWLETGPPQ
jgi:hypothetical protein